MTREQLQARVAALQAEHASLNEEELRFRSKSVELNDQIQQFGGEKFAARRAELKEKIGIALKAAQDAAERKTQVNAELGRLQNELATAYDGTTPKMVRKAKANVDDAHQEVEALQTKIDDLSAASGGQAPGQLAALQERRRALAAHVVLGEASEGEVQALDQQIAALEPAAKREAAAQADRDAAVEVLRQRLTQAGARMKQAKDEYRLTAKGYLRGAAEEAAKVYRDAAEGLIQAYRRVIAFNRLLPAADLAVMMPSAPDITLPRLYARAFPEKAHQSDYRSFYVAAADRDGCDQAMGEVKAELKAAGVDL